MNLISHGHLSDEVLFAFATDTLDNEDDRQAGRHLLVCRSCRDRMMPKVEISINSIRVESENYRIRADRQPEFLSVIAD